MYFKNFNFKVDIMPTTHDLLCENQSWYINFEVDYFVDIKRVLKKLVNS